MASLLRLNICDSQTGICFYEKIWKWSSTSVAEGICKLVLTFHKLSNEIGDTGEVKGVLFEQPIQSNPNPLALSNNSISTGSSSSTSPSTPTSTTTTTTNVRHSFHHSRTPSSTGSSSTAKRIKSIVTPPPIRLSCEKDDIFTVSVFYENPGMETEIKNFILNIKKEFHVNYDKLIPQLRPILNEMSEFPEKCKTKPEEIMNNFKLFEKTAEDLKTKSKLT